MANDEALMALARKRAQDKIEFYIHFTVYVAVNALLIVIWWFVGDGSVIPLPARVLGHRYRRPLPRRVCGNRHDRQDDAARVRATEAREVEGYSRVLMRPYEH